MKKDEQFVANRVAALEKVVVRGAGDKRQKIEYVSLESGNSVFVFAFVGVTPHAPFVGVYVLGTSIYASVSQSCGAVLELEL